MAAAHRFQPPVGGARSASVSHPDAEALARFRRAALVGLLAAGGLGCGARRAEDEAGGPLRHLLVISLDTLRADRLGSYGAARPTPHLDSLAREGVRFEHAMTPAPTTLGAHTSLMTGTWPHTHGVARNGFVLAGENETLAELLAAAGFHTAAFLGSFALESRFGFDQGFEHFDERFDVLVGPDGATNDQDQRVADAVTVAALEHVDRVVREGRRLFLFVHYFDAHANYAPPPAYARRVTGDASATSDQRDVEQSVSRHQADRIGPEDAVGHSGAIINGFHGPLRELLGKASGEPDEKDRLMSALYDGEVAYIDDAVGDLLAGLEARGLYDRMLVVLVGDHGETFWEHADLWNHGLWVYDTTVRVPLVLRRPDGAWDGRVVSEPVSTIDVLPTLCELLGIAPPARVEGRSLLAAIEGRPFERGPIFSEATQPYKVEQGLAGWRNATKPQAVRLGPWKYVRSRYNEVEELFDLEHDPLEQRNLLREGSLAPATAAVLEGLRAALEAWNRGARPLPSHFEKSQTEETRRRLEGLGYTGDDEQPK